MRNSDWSSDVCSSDLRHDLHRALLSHHGAACRVDGAAVARRRLTPQTPTEASQQFSFTRRALVLGAAQGGIGLLLAARMGYLSIFEQERYKLLAESNRVSLQLIPPRRGWIVDRAGRSEEHTSELQSLMRISYAVFSLKKKK